ncbi:MAG: DUF2608 domain-containing protein [Bacteriovoracaceae bacterium]|jgi:hypothetical protein|nr:DUF2608 domain-containing protein [Bacteriovoracaceae bacterium]
MKIFLMSFLIFTRITYASESISAANYSIVQEKINQIRSTHPQEEILIVSDFDNTLMKPMHLLGSDQFYEWQAHLMKTNDKLKDFENFEEFMEFHAKAMQLTKMTLTDPEIPALINAWKDNNIHMIVLTSRGPFFRSITERDLRLQGLNIQDLSPAKDLIEVTKIQERDAHFMNGLFFTSGLHKGEALHHFLQKSQKTYKHIIFIDDMEKHTKNVFEHFSTHSDLKDKVNIITIRYSREDGAKELFLKNDKKAKKEIKALKKFLKTYFP